ncbi:transposase, partial [Mycetohabitans sp. B4]|nr:transposase [Mycetohabitans sp. B4]
MKKSRFTDSQIVEALKRVEAGLAVLDLCRELGISTATFYNVALEVRRHGRVADCADEGTGGRECPAAQDGRRGEDQGRNRFGGTRKKGLRPSRRREMAMHAVSSRGISIRLA